ncbi:RimJ/RimL family protein N-acetyltransferase [Stackebrandtia albiflava]|uniref:RimJ/RimL family protein N-acetyltransferase n=1 Tax=Stackebrandtia albiflava TaxID=406432 RepID=A0A562VAF8_9ACTN|nr:GNAT family protein [Stackebrandtia albiflava]TWJ14869.1 RimJ/RimL family protein N-acetyltransferase [Stackebrandtia albiflava]
MTEADFSVKPTLAGALVRLEPMSEEHFEGLWRATSEPEVARLTGSHGEITAARAREWVATRAQTTDRLDLAVVDLATGECVGEVVLNDWSPEDGRCNFRILLGEAGRGRGLGAEATRLIVGYGFERLGLHRIGLTVFAFNPRARRAYEKVGFVAEGVERDALCWEGRRYDSVWMSILAPEWSRHRGFPDAETG